MSSRSLIIDRVNDDLANVKSRVEQHQAEIQRHYAKLSGIYVSLCQSNSAANKLKLLTAWYDSFVKIKRLRNEFAAELSVFSHLLASTNALEPDHQSIKIHQQFLHQLDRLSSHIVSQPHTFDTRWLAQPAKKGHQRQEHVGILELQRWSLAEIEDFYKEQRTQLEQQLPKQARSAAFEERLLREHRFPELSQQLRLFQEHYLLKIYAKTYEDYTQELVRKVIPLFYGKQGRVLNSQINDLSYLLDPLLHNEEALVRALTSPQELATPLHKQQIRQLLKHEIKLLTKLRSFTIDAMRREDAFVKANVAGKERTLTQRLKVAIPLTAGPLRDLVNREKVKPLQLIEAHIAYVQKLHHQLEPWLSTASDPMASIDYLFSGAATQLDQCRTELQQFERLLTDTQLMQPSQLPEATLHDLLALHQTAIARNNQLVAGFSHMTNVGNYVNDRVTEHHLMVSCRQHGSDYKQLAKRCETQLIGAIASNLEAVANQVECLSLMGAEEKLAHVSHIEEAIGRLQAMLTIATASLEKQEHYKPKDSLQQLVELKDMVKQLARFSTEPLKLDPMFAQLTALRSRLSVQAPIVAPAEPDTQELPVTTDAPSSAKSALFTQKPKAENPEPEVAQHRRCMMTFG